MALDTRFFTLVPTRCAHRYTHVYSRPSLDMDVGTTAYVEIALVPTGSVGMQSRRAAPRITISVWRIRDAARPALRSHAARGNERFLGICV